MKIETTSEYFGVATASGDTGAATASGACGTATASGDTGAAMASGYLGTATASGACGTAMASGTKGAATGSGPESCACAVGIGGMARGPLGAGWTIAEWTKTNHRWHRVNVQTIQVDGERVRPNIFYMLQGGQFVETA